MTLYTDLRVMEELPRFIITDAPVWLEGMPDPGFYRDPVCWEGIASHYGLPAEMQEWQERLLDCRNPAAIAEERPSLHCGWVTSYEKNAVRQGFFGHDPFHTLAAIGVVKTRDGNVVIGTRGGAQTPERVMNMGVGLYAVAPGGSVSFTGVDPDPISQTVLHEFVEELGDFPVTSTRFLGTFQANRPGPTGLKFVTEITTEATLQDLQYENRIARRRYDRLIADGASKTEASADLAKNKLPPDAWEHSVLIGVPDDPRALEHLLEVQPQSFAGIGAGAIALYVESRKRMA